MTAHFLPLDQTHADILSRPHVNGKKAQEVFGGAEGLKKLQSELAAAIESSELKEPVNALRDKIKTCMGTVNDQKKLGEAATGLADAETALIEAQEELTKLLSGNGSTKHEAVTKAYEAYETGVSKAKGLFDGFLGRVRVEGFKEGVQKNIQGMHFLKEGQSLKQRGMAFGRASVAVGGVAAIGHAVLAGKNSSGEERSGMARLVEGLAGVGAVGGSLVLGRAL